MPSGFFLLILKQTKSKKKSREKKPLTNTQNQKTTPKPPVFFQSRKHKAVIESVPRKKHYSWLDDQIFKTSSFSSSSFKILTALLAL